MYLRLQKYMARRIERHSFQNDDELSLYIMSFVASAFCFAVHVFLLTLFAFHLVPSLIYLNIFSIAVYVLLFYLLRKRRYILIGLLLSAEVMLYATVSGILHGIHNYIIGYYLLVIVMQVMVPYGSARLRTGVVLSTLACASVTLFIGVSRPPQVPFAATLNGVTTITNVYILLIGVMVELFIGNIVRAIVAQVNAERIRTLSAQAHTDALTGLYNRHYADRYFGDMIHSEAPVVGCVAMLDIDDFKEINDAYGHACGDEVLVFLADFLRSNLRKTDILFRWGGEEFLIVLENAEPQAAYRILNKLRGELSATDIPTSKGIRRITVTIGIAALNQTDPYASIDHSDSNMYKGKRGTKNVTVMD